MLEETQHQITTAMHHIANAQVLLVLCDLNLVEKLSEVEDEHVEPREEGGGNLLPRTAGVG